MADKLHHTSAQVISAIKGSGGIKQTVADRLGVHRNTIDRYLNRFPAAMQAYQDEVEAQGDYAETVLIWQLHEQEATGDVDKNGNAIKKPTEESVDTAKWYLDRKGRKRGYGNRQDITSDDQPITWLDIINQAKNNAKDKTDAE